MGYCSEFLSHNKDNGMTNEVRKLKDGLFVGVISTRTDHVCRSPVDPETGRGKPHAGIMRGPIGPWKGVDDLKVDAAVAR